MVEQKEEWLDNMEQMNRREGLSINAIRTYRTRAKLYLAKHDSLDWESCAEYIDELRQTRSPQTVNLSISALRRLTKANGIEVSLKAEKTIRSLSTENIPSMDDYTRILDYLKQKDSDYLQMVMLLATTGLRIHEALKVTKDDVLAGKMVIRGKGGKRRIVFFCDALKNCVRERCESGPVFRSRFGSVITSRGFSTELKAIGDKVCVDRKKMHPHAFRHFFAKNYLKHNPGAISTLSELLGHASLDTTMIYLQKTEAEKMEDFNKAVVW